MFFDIGYAKALWDYRIHAMALGADGKTIYVRDVDESGGNAILRTWHAVASIEDEYHVPKQREYKAWNLQFRIELKKEKIRVQHGVKFRNCAFLRVNGNIRKIHKEDSLFVNPFDVYLDVEFDSLLAGQATQWLRFVTADQHSAENLGRMFATPLLEKYKHLFYVLYGEGGNGKGILLDALARTFPRLAAAIQTDVLLGSSFDAGQMRLSQLQGRYWVFDQDSEIVNLRQASQLKKIAGGDMMFGRRTQKDMVAFSNTATLIVATNEPVVLSGTRALKRRRVFVRMNDDVAIDDPMFDKLIAFVNRWGAAPFLMASCCIWQFHGDKPWDDVTIGSGEDLSDAEQWIVDQIAANGYAASRDNPYPEKPGEHQSSVAKLGLASKSKKIDGQVIRVLVVKDEQTFSVYHKASDRSIRAALEEAGDIGHVPLPAPRQMGDILPTPDELGYPVTFGSIDHGKVSKDWSRNKTLPAGRKSPTGKAYAVVPGSGMAIIDLDAAKSPEGAILKDASTGWDIFNREVGAYGSPDFPRTLLVSTPTGKANSVPSAHAYYLLPPTLQGHLKNAVHEGGIPVDIRCEGKGYVLGPGSELDDGGYYELLDLPDGLPPVMPEKMIRWLASHGYIETTEPRQRKKSNVTHEALPSLSEVLNQSITIGTGVSSRPDMTPVPAGQRNVTLHAWAYGRLKNHPENQQSIMSDLFRRGTDSGLEEDEIQSMWRSILRELGGAA